MFNKKHQQGASHSLLKIICGRHSQDRGLRVDSKKTQWPGEKRPTLLNHSTKYLQYLHEIHDFEHMLDQNGANVQLDLGKQHNRHVSDLEYFHNQGELLGLQRPQSHISTQCEKKHCMTASTSINTTMSCVASKRNKQAPLMKVIKCKKPRISAMSGIICEGQPQNKNDYHFIRDVSVRNQVFVPCHQTTIQSKGVFDKQQPFKDLEKDSNHSELDSKYPFSSQERRSYAKVKAEAGNMHRRFVRTAKIQRQTYVVQNDPQSDIPISQQKKLFDLTRKSYNQRAQTPKQNTDPLEQQLKHHNLKRFYSQKEISRLQKSRARTLKQKQSALQVNGHLQQNNFFVSEVIPHEEKSSSLEPESSAQQSLKENKDLKNNSKLFWHDAPMRLKDYESNFQAFKAISNIIDQKMKWKPKKKTPRSSVSFRTYKF